MARDTETPKQPNRFKQMWYVTIPSILPTIAIMLIMAVGGILGSNTDLILLLYNTATYPTADVIGTYIYRVGIEGGQFSYTAAVTVISTKPGRYWKNAWLTKASPLTSKSLLLTSIRL